MRNNARAVVTPDGNWGEIGVSQFVQSRAANVATTTDVNPLLLKPRGEGESQLVIQGAAVGHCDPGEYYDEYWNEARRAAIDPYERLRTSESGVLSLAKDNDGYAIPPAHVYDERETLLPRRGDGGKQEPRVPADHRTACYSPRSRSAIRAAAVTCSFAVESPVSSTSSRSAAI